MTEQGVSKGKEIAKSNTRCPDVMRYMEEDVE